MADTPQKPQTPVERVGLEKDRTKVELYRPASILRTTEWGLLTVTSLLAALAFPPYFIAVLWSAFFSAGGMLWVTHLSESGRLRLKGFEREFSEGHSLEEAGQYQQACDFYAALAPKFQDYPKIAEIALRRIEYLKAEHPQAFQAPQPSLDGARSAKHAKAQAKPKVSAQLAPSTKPKAKKKAKRGGK
jgi:hypothetical protein